MMQLTQSVWLWGLVALAIPVAIHLLSRKEGRVVPVGSLRHLRETTSQQFRGIKPNELLLLALRALLIIIFVLLLAGLFWKNSERQRWVIVDRALMQDTRAMALADSLLDKGYEWRWLESEFPKRDKTRTTLTKNNWQLIEQLHTQHLQHAVVLSTSLQTEFKGEHKHLGSHIDWQVFELPDVKSNVYAIEKAGNKFVRTILSSATRTHFATDTVRVLPDSLPQLKQIRVSVVTDKGFEEDARIVLAALKSITSTLPVSIEIKSEQQPDAGWLIWLSEKSVPETKAKLITINPTPSNQFLEPRALNLWQLTKRLTVDVALQKDFTIQLAQLITKEAINPEVISTLDNRVLPEAFFKKTEIAAASVVDAEFNIPLLILFLLTLIAERVVAFVRKQ
jgi:Aerotolerance regulator N-terminal